MNKEEIRLRRGTWFFGEKSSYSSSGINFPFLAHFQFWSGQTLTKRRLFSADGMFSNHHLRSVPSPLSSQAKPRDLRCAPAPEQWSAFG
jgi:hypothetical protein